ncbi:MAG TPA: ABC transporter permease [Microthrixaceae bacterium]|nr:ABC transporter permease [Microthrixaceae bacterium]
MSKVIDQLAVPRWCRRLLGPAVVVAFWALASEAGWLDPQTLASPTTVFSTGVDLVGDGRLPEALWVSVQRVLWGLLFGITAGTVLAVVSGLFRLGEDVIDSSVQFLRTLPVFALIPLFILWFGIGEEVKIILIAVAVSFPVYINTFSAIRGVDEKLVEAAQTFGLGRAALVRNVVLPGALPGFLVGLRFSLVIAWLVLVVAETINATKGMGYLMNEARAFGQTDVLVVALVTFGVLGILSDAFVRLLERNLLSWRRSFSGT